MPYPHTHTSSLRSISPTRVGHLLQSMNLHWRIVITQTLEFTLGFTLVLYVSCNLTHDTMTCIHHCHDVWKSFIPIKILYSGSIHPFLARLLYFHLIKETKITYFISCCLSGNMLVWDLRIFNSMISRKGKLRPGAGSADLQREMGSRLS